MFRFGPHNGSSSHERFAYPAGLGGSFAVMFFSCVDEDAPALMSRQCVVALGALPDISIGKMHYRAVGTTTNLYLSSRGHIAVLDEWPAQMPPWPFSMPLNHKDLPDVWSPGAREVCAQALYQQLIILQHLHSFMQPGRAPPSWLRRRCAVLQNLMNQLIMQDCRPLGDVLRSSQPEAYGIAF